VLAVHTLISGMYVWQIAKAVSPSRCTCALCSAGMQYICCGHLSYRKLPGRFTFAAPSCIVELCCLQLSVWHAY